MATGKVMWFSDQKGYGFIEVDGGGPSVFVHYAAIEMEGHRTLREGQIVSFELEKSPKGLRATRVTPANGPVVKT